MQTSPAPDVKANTDAPANLWDHVFTGVDPQVAQWAHKPIQDAAAKVATLVQDFSKVPSAAVCLP